MLFMKTPVLALLALFAETKKQRYTAYEVYELVDRMEKLTDKKYTTFYELLGVAENAQPRDIGRAYRKMSVKYHPDKNKENKHATKFFELLASINELLQDTAPDAASLEPPTKKKEDEHKEHGRVYYDYILHQAPGWHRQLHYSMVRPLRKTGKLGSASVAGLIVAVIFFCHFSTRLSLYLISQKRKRATEKHGENASKKELKKMLRKQKKEKQIEETPFPELQKLFPINLIGGALSVFRKNRSTAGSG
ncbi:MAG: DnaJ-domain-containing protein [Amphiamblys sp. WSBS2006]|nr:MAG: DnaJ-domain-containing protein [Amphiamblys sp. WSBS2006]